LLDDGDEVTEGLGVEAGGDGDSPAIGKDQFERLLVGSAGGGGIGEDGDRDEVGSGGVGGTLVRGNVLGGGGLVEAFSEGVKGDSAAAAELGVGQSAVAEVAEDGIPACVREGDVGHGRISRAGRSAPSGYDRGRSPGFPDALHRTDSAPLKTGRE
jgi:hypothetical protein